VPIPSDTGLKDKKRCPEFIYPLLMEGGFCFVFVIEYSFGIR
jgi:hypothetical protein